MKKLVLTDFNKVEINTLTGDIISQNEYTYEVPENEFGAYITVFMYDADGNEVATATLSDDNEKRDNKA